MEEIEKQKLSCWESFPRMRMFTALTVKDAPTVQLPADSPVRAALKEIIDNLGI